MYLSNQHQVVSPYKPATAPQSLMFSNAVIIKWIGYGRSLGRNGLDMYEIVRFYQDGRKQRVQKRNLTLKQAQEWCNDPETSSMTAKNACGDNQKMIDRWHAKQKHWFDGYREQK